MARRRHLSVEERRLWDQVAATAVPLRPAAKQKAAAAGSAVAPALPVAGDRSAPPVVASIRAPRAAATAPRVTVDLAPDPHATLAERHPRMDRGRFDRLRRGRLEPEARLDLHGMTLETAHAALVGFVLSADSQELRLLLVITGKGRAPDGSGLPQRHGILRHSVPHWLAAPPLAGRVLDVVPAHQRHGGGGAYYVYLRRRR
jgi:DNA-nicking Smr family endonuclease